MELDAGGKVRRLLAGAFVCMTVVRCCKCENGFVKAKLFVHLLTESSVLWEKGEEYLQKEKERQGHG